VTHPLVDQLRFARAEFRRGLAGVTDDEATQRFGPINSIGWMVGHLAAHEAWYWRWLLRGEPLAPDLAAVQSGQPASTPSLAAMWVAWEAVTTDAGTYLDSLTSEALLTHLMRDGKEARESLGTMIRRLTYHYWFHLGEAVAVRQLLGHTDLPEFVGAIGREAPYRVEES
jgi:uncharacterized damage-inducible protein DinB